MNNADTATAIKQLIKKLPNLIFEMTHCEYDDSTLIIEIYFMSMTGQPTSFNFEFPADFLSEDIPAALSQIREGVSQYTLPALQPNLGETQH